MVYHFPSRSLQENYGKEAHRCSDPPGETPLPSCLWLRRCLSIFEGEICGGRREEDGVGSWGLGFRIPRKDGTIKYVCNFPLLKTSYMRNEMWIGWRWREGGGVDNARKRGGGAVRQMGWQNDHQAAIFVGSGSTEMWLTIKGRMAHGECFMKLYTTVQYECARWDFWQCF